MKHDEQCWKNQSIRDLGAGGPLASCTCGLDALLRVARAADYIFSGHRDRGVVCGTCDTRLDVLDLLKEALKEVEGLLGDQ